LCAIRQTYLHFLLDNKNPNFAAEVFHIFKIEHFNQRLLRLARETKNSRNESRKVRPRLSDLNNINLHNHRILPQKPNPYDFIVRSVFSIASKLTEPT